MHRGDRSDSNLPITCYHFEVKAHQLSSGDTQRLVQLDVKCCTLTVTKIRKNPLYCAAYRGQVAFS